MTQTQHPIHFVGLGADPKGASFYDLLAWYVDSENGVFTYDAAEDSYKLAAEKAAEGTPGKLQPIELAAFRTEYPETPRFKVNVQNSDSASAATNEIANEQAATNIRRDYLVRTTIAQQVTDRQTLETNRLILREPEVVVEFGEWPTTGFLPGALVDFSHADFGTDIAPSGNTYRSRSVRLAVRAPAELVRQESTTSTQNVRINLEVRLELQDEKFVALPDYVLPSFTVEVEGIVVSEQGEDAEETYQFYTDENTSVDQYKIKVPLWDNKIIVVPYEPLGGFSSHFYFPLVKNERVLVAISFRSARIVRTLDWRPGAKLPMDGQGDHIVLGKQASDQWTLSLTYVDAKPVLSAKRVKDKDTELLEMQEGKILLRTKEDD